MASHRIGARVAGLSPAQLCAIIEAQAGASDAALHVAEEHATRLVEQPEWILSEVLLSPDLAPHILAQLPTEAHAAKGTCRAWRRGWEQTLEKRERPLLLVVGGDDNGEFPSSMERYDPSTNEWEEEAVAPMLTARKFVGAAVLDGKLYAAGGQDVAANDATSDLVEWYDFAANAWVAVAPMASARESLAVAVLDDKLYAVGGLRDVDENNFDTLSSAERYDPVLDAWEAVAPMAVARRGLAVAVLDGKLYALGGYDATTAGMTVLSSVERYDPVTNVWEEAAPMAEPRCLFAVAVLDGKLYAGGGGDHISRHDSVERYDPVTNAWEEVAPMAESRGNHAMVALEGNLYASGGLDWDESLLATVERYDPRTNAWEEVAPMATARIVPVAALMSSM